MTTAPVATATPASAAHPASPDGDPSHATVRRRHVFLIPGFDPKSERWYHALYRNQARRQSVVNGLAIEVGKARVATDGPGWQWSVRCGGGPGAVDTTVELLCWDDIVRAHWAERPSRVLWDGLRTVLYGLRDGAVQRMFRLYRPPVYAVFFPLAVLAVTTALAALAGLAASRGLSGLAGWPAVAAHLAGTLLALALAGGAVAVVHRIQFTWLLRLVHFTVQHATGRVPELDQRLARFAARIGAVQAAATHDEVLVVGHSVGATLALPVLAQVLAQAPGGRLVPEADRGEPPRLALLSLGQCIPLMSALSAAQGLRQALDAVARSPLPWLDVTAPIDWAAFPGIDPVRGAGLPPAPTGWHPRCISPRFHQLFGPQAYARLKRNRFQVHLQYLMASERAGRYDFYAITAGPQALTARFAEPPARGPAPAESPE